MVARCIFLAYIIRVSLLYSIESNYSTRFRSSSGVSQNILWIRLREIVKNNHCAVVLTRPGTYWSVWTTSDRVKQPPCRFLRRLCQMPGTTALSFMSTWTPKLCDTPTAALTSTSTLPHPLFVRALSFQSNVASFCPVVPELWRRSSHRSSPVNRAVGSTVGNDRCSFLSAQVHFGLVPSSVTSSLPPCHHSNDVRPPPSSLWAVQSGGKCTLTPLSAAACASRSVHAAFCDCRNSCTSAARLSRSWWLTLAITPTMRPQTLHQPADDRETMRLRLLLLPTPGGFWHTHQSRLRCRGKMVWLKALVANNVQSHRQQGQS